MDIIQEIKKRQEKIDANTERIFKPYGVSYLTSPNPLTTPNKCGTI